MTAPLAVAAELLERHYRCLPVPEPEASWRNAWRVLIDPKRLTDRNSAWENTCLVSPEETAEGSAAEVQEMLKQLKLSEKLAFRLQGLARWWLKYASDNDPQLSGMDDEGLRGSLRKIPGVTREQGDELALLVFGRRVLPLNRAMVRVGCRHRWIGWDAEDEEWQGLFQQGLREGDCRPEELATWISEVAKDYCRAEPRCEECPLRSLLPESGPDEPLE